jgi:hypothetical protein
VTTDDPDGLLTSQSTTSPHLSRLVWLGEQLQEATDQIAGLYDHDGIAADLTADEFGELRRAASAARTAGGDVILIASAAHHRARRHGPGDTTRQSRPTPVTAAAADIPGGPGEFADPGPYQSREQAQAAVAAMAALHGVPPGAENSTPGMLGELLLMEALFRSGVEVGAWEDAARHDIVQALPPEVIQVIAGWLLRARLADIDS